MPLFIIYYININYGFFYNEDTSLHTVVNYIANPSGTNYLSEKTPYIILIFLLTTQQIKIYQNIIKYMQIYLKIV